ncbi:alpha/beta fold hydrolase [Mycolicibacterium stellerae]|uniref:alpha/beta fold hydrolase n=1 Tax=Mycolicibacterium stellerae TaxID=2358193 RepID=UPI000F0BACF0|nr:alpha/beta fold hydrolase [Mycolicibacterium stellerae]
MEQFRRGDLVFDVIDAGPADGPVVVLLHGFPESNAMYQPVIDRLVAQGYRCLAPLQRGYSPGARPKRRRDYRDSELVGDILTLIDASGAQRVHLVGHDWGAAVAWYVAQRFPERLITLTALSVPHPAAFLKAVATSRQAASSWYMLFFQLPWLPERLLLSKRAMAGFMASRSAPELAEAEVTAIRQPGTLTAALNWYRAMPFGNPTETARKVTVPTMYVWSDDDIALKEKGARLCADYVVAEYRFEVLAGASHWLLDEQPETVAGLLLEWLGTHSGARA